MGTLILTQADVASVVTMDAAVAAIEQAFAVHGRGEALMPPKVYLSLPKHDGDFRARTRRRIGLRPEKHNQRTQFCGLFPDQQYEVSARGT